MPQTQNLGQAPLELVSWFNQQRLLEPIGYIPPAEAEAQYYRRLALNEFVAEADSQEDFNEGAPLRLGLRRSTEIDVGSGNMNVCSRVDERT